MAAAFVPPWQRDADPVPSRQDEPEPVSQADPSLAPMGESVWVEYKTPEGRPYYFNRKTQQSVWEKPDDLKTPQEVRLIYQMSLYANSVRLHWQSSLGSSMTLRMGANTGITL